jgi:hypothetical protein
VGRQRQGHDEVSAHRLDPHRGERHDSTSKARVKKSAPPKAAMDQAQQAVLKDVAALRKK